MEHSIYIATTNKGKIKDFEALLSPLGITITSSSNLMPEVEETGNTFAQNALLKAQALFEIVQKPVIADDSGLSVVTLNGAPGIFSSRYAGLDASDAQNRALLLKNLSDTKNRKATFICAIALVRADGTFAIFEGIAEGEITTFEQGLDGFGYDSLFFSSDLEKTFAQSTQAEKNLVSHRAKALKLLLTDPFFKKKREEHTYASTSSL
ncbi:dITP/XTP pyrophosphatase [Erysipelotrichaceae bacterium]|nr:dITP/XTP pyrophosphatase [Erysipelotrichaceae bacterium]